MIYKQFPLSFGMYLNSCIWTWRYSSLRNPSILVCKMKPHRKDKHSIYFLLNLSFSYFPTRIMLLLSEWQNFIMTGLPFVLQVHKFPLKKNICFDLLPSSIGVKVSRIVIKLRIKKTKSKKRSCNLQRIFSQF